MGSRSLGRHPRQLEPATAVVADEPKRDSKRRVPKAMGGRQCALDLVRLAVEAPERDGVAFQAHQPGDAVLYGAAWRRVGGASVWVVTPGGCPRSSRRAQGLFELCRLELGGVQPVLEGKRADVAEAEGDLCSGARPAADSLDIPL